MKALITPLYSVIDSVKRFTERNTSKLRDKSKSVYCSDTVIKSEYASCSKGGIVIGITRYERQ